MKEKEHQSIEWKESWRDEYLKWICGYANAYGGTIYIGTNDNGKVVGINNARELLEQIPNKITDTMGIIADVNLLYQGELEYLQISVDKYPALISFRGKYYYRSGIMVLCKACDKYLKLLKDDGQRLGQYDQDNDQDKMTQIIDFCKEPKSANEILQEFDLERSYFRRHYLDKLLKAEKLKRTIPDKPKSRNQRYYS